MDESVGTPLSAASLSLLPSETHPSLTEDDAEDSMSDISAQETMGADEEPLAFPLIPPDPYPKLCYSCQAKLLY